MISVLMSTDRLYYAYWFAYAEPSLYLGSKIKAVTGNGLVTVLLGLDGKNFHSVFIGEMRPSFSFLLQFCLFGIGNLGFVE